MVGSRMNQRTKSTPIPRELRSVFENRGSVRREKIGGRGGQIGCSGRHPDRVDVRIKE